MPERGASAPPPSANLTRGGVAPKTDIGWKEDRALFRRFGHPNAWSDHGSCSPVVIESYDSLGPTRLYLEIVHRRCLVWILTGTMMYHHHLISSSNSLGLLSSFHSVWTPVAGSLLLTSRQSLE